MKKLLFSQIVLALLALNAFGKSKLEGVWQTVEVKVESGSHAGTFTKEPGMLIFTGTHYSMLVPLSDTRTQLDDPEKGTAAELLALYGPFIANSGTYELSGDTVTMRPMVAKNPAAAKAGVSIKISFQLKGDTLTTNRIPTSATEKFPIMTMTFKRLE